MLHWRPRHNLKMPTPRGVNTSHPLGRIQSVKSVIRSAGAALHGQHKEYQYRTDKSDCEENWHGLRCQILTTALSTAVSRQCRPQFQP